MSCALISGVCFFLCKAHKLPSPALQLIPQCRYYYYYAIACRVSPERNYWHIMVEDDLLHFAIVKKLRSMFFHIMYDIGML